MLLKTPFYEQSTRSLAKSLLGTFLVSTRLEGKCIARIVETEAYLFRGDPACHAHKGVTKRNACMFGPAGTAYVYLIYGMYYCFNVVSGEKGIGEAVLIRALEPISGIELMKERRQTKDLRNLCSGPGKLALALDIGAEDNGQILRKSSLCLHTSDSFKSMYKGAQSSTIVKTTRIGISKGKELPLRFYLKDNEFISRK